MPIKKPVANPNPHYPGHITPQDRAIYENIKRDEAEKFKKLKAKEEAVYKAQAAKQQAMQKNKR